MTMATLGNTIDDGISKLSPKISGEEGNAKSKIGADAVAYKLWLYLYLNPYTFHPKIQ
jgi:hypothetical protein